MQKKEYARTVDAAALGLLLHTAMSRLCPDISSSLLKGLETLGLALQGNSRTVLTYLINIILYSAVFFLPALFISRTVPSRESIGFRVSFPKYFPVLLLAALGHISAAGNITALTEKLFSRIGIGFTDYTPDIPDSVSGIVLFFVYSAVVPALTEELLFRKVILERLVPYGRNFAVIVTAAAFSLMHANPAQFFYAFTAGIFLGYMTVSCGSVIPAVTVHFANNALSVFYLLLNKYADSSVFAVTASTVDLILILFGLTAVNVMFGKGLISFKKDSPPDGVKPASDLFRVFVLLYAAYTLYLSTRWIYLI